MQLRSRNVLPRRVAWTATSLLVAGAIACSSGGGSTPDSGAAATGGVPAKTGGSSGTAGSGGAGGAGATGGASATGGARGCMIPADPEAPATTLAATGCMDPQKPTQFASFAAAYEVNSPLWSDAADKERAMVLPPGGKIRVLDCVANADACLDAADEGKWIFPVGTILVKNFLFDGKVVETRLFDSMPDNSWVGYSYQWDEAQTKATLVAAEGAHVTFNTGKRSVEWTYPGRRDCTGCHTRTSGWSLGPETAQMNRIPTSAALGTQNQIDRFAAMGLFEKPPAKPYKAALPTPYSGSWGNATSTASVADRARSYLHANCAYCHRPDGEFNSIDYRFDTTFKNTQLCNSTPRKGNQNVAGATNLTPGSPELSLTWLRMNTLDRGRMPTIGSAVLDQDALNLVSDWIKGVKTCP